MFGFHWAELLVILFAAIVIFGPKRLPEIGQSVGKTFRSFKRGVSEIDEPAAVNELPHADRYVRTSVDGQDVARTTSQSQSATGPGTSS